MSKNPFSVGDRIVTTDSTMLYPKNRLCSGVVTRVMSECLEITFDAGDTNILHYTYLKPATTQRFKVGDRVRYTGCNIANIKGKITCFREDGSINFVPDDWWGPDNWWGLHPSIVKQGYIITNSDQLLSERSFMLEYKCSFPKDEQMQAKDKAKPRFQVGDKIEYQSNNNKNKWYPGTVAQLPRLKNYTITDDGYNPLVPGSNRVIRTEQEIRVPITAKPELGFKLNDKVEYRSPTNELRDVWFTGKIVGFNENGHLPYRVKDNGEHPTKPGKTFSRSDHGVRKVIEDTMKPEIDAQVSDATAEPELKVGTRVITTGDASAAARRTLKAVRIEIVAQSIVNQ